MKIEQLEQRITTVNDENIQLHKENTQLELQLKDTKNQLNQQSAVATSAAEQLS